MDHRVGYVRPSYPGCGPEEAQARRGQRRVRGDSSRAGEQAGRGVSAPETAGRVAGSAGRGRAQKGAAARRSDIMREQTTQGREAHR